MKQVNSMGAGLPFPEPSISLRSPWAPLVHRTRLIPAIVLCLFAGAATPSRGDVDLLWDPPTQGALQNEIVNVALYAVLDDTGLNPNIGVIEVILNWDPVRLEFIGKVDNGPYTWFASGFPNDSLQDGLNAPYSGTPANDGNAWYNALSQFGAGQEAIATPAGLLVTTFQFRALALGVAEVSMVATAGGATETRVLDGVIPGLVSTGDLGPPAEIIVTAGTVPAAPVADISGIKTRFISFSPDNLGRETALRVWLTSLHHPNPPYTGGPTVPFTAFEGEYRWVGPPDSFMESTVSSIQFYSASLQCDPYYQDWGAIGLLHVTGSAIVPSSIYDVESVAIDCLGTEDTCTLVSDPVAIGTTRWGDVTEPYAPPSLTVQPDITDVSALVDKFRNAPGAPIKARGLQAGEPGNPFGEITDPVIAVDFSFAHISACVDAFRGVPYPYTISSCP